MKPLKDLLNQTFGKWKVLRRGPNNVQGQAQWICECECGVLKIVKGSHLRGKRSTQCKTCHNRTFNRRHGKYKTLSYAIWESMLQRCTNKNDRAFKNYGGRGITVCDEWRKDFMNFWSDMGEKPKGLSIDRIDNDGPYCKENCRWATRQQQLSNTRKSHKEGNIYGTWRMVENTPISKKSLFECINCGIKWNPESYYVTSGTCADCKCRCS